MQQFQQTLSMSALVFPHLKQRLTAAQGLVNKAAQHAEKCGYHVSRLYSARLYPDMHDFTMQIKLVSESVKLSLTELSGRESPSWPDLEPTTESLLERLRLASEYLAEVDEAEIADSADKQIELSIPMGPIRKLNFTGFSFHTEYVIPQLSFHLSLAHAILRHNGVKIGKLDYMGVI